MNTKVVQICALILMAMGVILNLSFWIEFQESKKVLAQLEADGLSVWRSGLPIFRAVEFVVSIGCIVVGVVLFRAHRKSIFSDGAESH